MRSHNLRPITFENLLLKTNVSEIWGIGRKISKQLQSYGILNCYDLTFANEHYLVREFSVLMARTIRELKGQSCIHLDDPHIPSKRILSSRSFASPLTQKQLLKQAMVFHLKRAHQRLMSQQQLSSCIHISLYEKVPYPPYKKSMTQAIGLEYATDDLLHLSQITMQQIDVLYQENISYVKIAVMFSALHPKRQHIDDLWQPKQLIQQRNKLMQTFLLAQQRYGYECIQVGYHSNQNHWQMKQQYLSPRYTTRWNEMLCIDDSHLAVTQNK